MALLQPVTFQRFSYVRFIFRLIWNRLNIVNGHYCLPALRTSLNVLPFCQENDDKAHNNNFLPFKQFQYFKEARSAEIISLKRPISIA